MNVSHIRSLIAQGWSDDEINDLLTDAAIDEAEARDLGDCDDYDRDERSSHEKEMCDRLDMGRNDAGEWLGFM